MCQRPFGPHFHPSCRGILVQWIFILTLVLSLFKLSLLHRIGGCTEINTHISRNFLAAAQIHTQTQILQNSTIIKIKPYFSLSNLKNTKPTTVIRAVKMGQAHRAGPSALYFSVGRAVKNAWKKQPYLFGPAHRASILDGSSGLRAGPF